MSKIVTANHYIEVVKEELPDKVINYKLKYDGKKIKHRFASYKTDKYDVIVGYTSGVCKDEVTYEDKDYLLVREEEFTYYSEILEKKPLFHRVVGNVCVGDSKYVSLTKSYFFIFWLLLGLLLLGFIVAPTLKEPLVQIGFSDKVEIEDNDNVVDLDNIPENTMEINLTQDMAYISGQSLTEIKESYQDVYLINDKRNDKYQLIYEVYVDGHKDYVYKTGIIPAGKAEPWNAYECDLIKPGENKIHYEVYVYDLDGNQVAQTSLTGLKIIRK